MAMMCQVKMGRRSLTFRHRYGGCSLPTEHNTAVLVVEQGVYSTVLGVVRTFEIPIAKQEKSYVTHVLRSTS